MKTRLNSKTLKYHTFGLNCLFFLLLVESIVVIIKKLFKAEESIGVLKTILLTNYIMINNH